MLDLGSSFSHTKMFTLEGHTELNQIRNQMEVFTNHSTAINSTPVWKISAQYQWWAWASSGRYKRRGCISLKMTSPVKFLTTSTESSQFIQSLSGEVLQNILPYSGQKIWERGCELARAQDPPAGDWWCQNCGKTSYSVTHTLLSPHSLLQELLVPCGIGFWAGRKTGASSLARIDSTLLVSTLYPPFFMCQSEPLMTVESLNRSSPSKEWLPTFQRLHLDLQSE